MADPVIQHVARSNIQTSLLKNTDIKQWPHKDNYPNQPPDPLKHKRMQIILVIILVPLLILGCFIASLCLTSGGRTLETAYFVFDSDAKLNETLLDELYHNLDADSQQNVTNETYFLILSIQDLDYSIRFDYLFEFTSNNFTNLIIQQHNEVPIITSFPGAIFDMMIQFHINSTDPDILEVVTFQPDNAILGDIQTSGVDSAIFFIQLDEGEVAHEDINREILILPYNQTIVGVAEFDHICPFR